MTLNSNEHRIIIAALETYQSMWAVAVTEAQRENEPIDERFTRERYVEAGELLAKFKAEPEGGEQLAMVGKLNANVAAEQARDRGRYGELVVHGRATGRDFQTPLLAAIRGQVNTIARVATALRLYYSLPGRENGGAVHIITEDGNVAQSDADWCVKNAPKWAAEFGEDAHLASDLHIARMLAGLTTQQRKTLYETGNFYPEEPSDRAILDQPDEASEAGGFTGGAAKAMRVHREFAARDIDELERLDHNLDDLRSADEESEEQ